MISVKNKFNYAYTQEFPYRTNHILECEFYLLENLDCCLIVYQPYRPLLQFASDAGLDDTLLALAWRVVNDSLRTDACLFFPPYQIALGKKEANHCQWNIKYFLCRLRFSANSLRDPGQGSEDLVCWDERGHGEGARGDAHGDQPAGLMEGLRRKEGHTGTAGQNAETKAATLKINYFFVLDLQLDDFELKSLYLLNKFLQVM